MHFERSPLIVWIALWKVNTYSEFQVNILNNNRYYKMSTFLHDHNDANENVNDKPIAIPRVFSKNSQERDTCQNIALLTAICNSK